MKITVVPQAEPDVLAMAQALNSRTTAPIADRLAGDPDKLRESMAKWYIGYGHESIGQCGFFTIFFEGVSMLAAKFIEEHGLFNGQETSSRYVDFSEAEYIGAHPEIAECSRAAYKQVLAAVLDKIGDQPGGKPRAFDIARAFLIPGFVTNVSWTASFDSFTKHAQWMVDHGDEEIRNLATAAFAAVKAMWPMAMPEGLQPSIGASPFTRAPLDGRQPNIRAHRLFGANPAMPHRRLIRSLDRYAMVQLVDVIDFAGWRDLSRHRVGWHNFPIPGLSLHRWYVGELRRLGVPDEVWAPAWFALKHAAAEIDDTCEFARNMPMGAVCLLEMHMPLGQAVYVARLRSASTVHPTVRQVAQRLADFLKREFNLDVGADMSPDAGPQAKRDGQTVRGEL